MILKASKAIADIEIANSSEQTAKARAYRSVFESLLEAINERELDVTDFVFAFTQEPAIEGIEWLKTYVIYAAPKSELLRLVGA